MEIRFEKYTSPEMEAKNEDRDCVVIALSVGFQVPYDTAYCFLAKLGRKPNKGFRIRNILWGNGSLFGKRFERVFALNGRTLRWAIAEFPKGRYILRKSGHAFALVDGVVIDYSVVPKPRSIITHIWQVLD